MDSVHCVHQWPCFQKHGVCFLTPLWFHRWPSTRLSSWRDKGYLLLIRFLLIKGYWLKLKAVALQGICVSPSSCIANLYLLPWHHLVSTLKLSELGLTTQRASCLVSLFRLNLQKASPTYHLRMDAAHTLSYLWSYRSLSNWSAINKLLCPPGKRHTNI